MSWYISNVSAWLRAIAGSWPFVVRARAGATPRPGRNNTETGHIPHVKYTTSHSLPEWRVAESAGRINGRLGRAGGTGLLLWVKVQRATSDLIAALWSGRRTKRKMQEGDACGGDRRNSQEDGASRTDGEGWPGRALGTIV